MAKACCVCGDAADKQDNLLFTCKGHGCDVVVHQGKLNERGAETHIAYVHARLNIIGKREVSLYTDTKAFLKLHSSLYVSFRVSVRLKTLAISSATLTFRSKATTILGWH